tara:strand:- start:495 stop:665 length:171 start_codon:yes stop_codon:yes gene_type:complete
MQPIQSIKETKAMAGKKKKNKKIEIVTKRIKEHGFKVTEGKDRFKSKTITLYERGN